MEESVIENLYQVSARLVRKVGLSYKRELYNQVNWDNRLIGIKGFKGVGKTTLLKQHIRESFTDLSKVLYVSMDNLCFASDSLMDLVEYHYSHGGEAIFLDEIHKYGNWQTTIKNIYDSYPDLKVVYTGSSILKLNMADADLSRRLRTYTLHGLSFREFLKYEKVLDWPICSMSDILSNHVNICSDIVSNVKILPWFEKYLKYGYYPYSKEEGDGFSLRLQSAIVQTIEQDFPSVENVEYDTLQKLKKLLMILAAQVPFIPNMKELYEKLETSREQGLKLITMLENAELIGTMHKRIKSVRQLSSPDKFFLGDPNMLYALSDKVEIGTIRETFFRNQLSAVANLSLPEKGDFLVDGKYLFEVGGAKKSFEQIKDEPDSYVAADGIEIGHGNKIPLWLFGFLY